MTYNEIKKIASTLADVSPKTEMEIVRLCKKLVLGIYEYLDIENLKELLDDLKQYDTRLEACENNKVYRHVIDITDERDTEDEPNTYFIVIDSTNNTPCTHETIVQFLQENVYNYKMYYKSYHQSEINILTNGSIFDEFETNYILRFDNTAIDVETLEELTLHDNVIAL